jgi:hypothetical protein
MADLPIACSLDASALNARREGLLARLVQRASERHELPDGIQLRFTADSQILDDIAEVVKAERLCCRFLRFTINVLPDEGPMTLDLTGPPGTSEFIAAILHQP